jgi:Leucine-rich repeat (LRR) protein
MSKKTPNIDKRLAYLAETFDVFDATEELDEIIDKYNQDSYEDIVKVVDPITNNILGLVSEKLKNEDSWRVIRKSSVELTVFSSMISADPTDNKIYLQWLLNTYSGFLRNNETEEAIRFACEDLPVAKQYLELFEQHKKKQEFKKLCSNNFNLSEIKDHSNINQYKSLSKLYDAVDPFIEKDYSGLKSNIIRYVNINEAEITYKSRHFTVYVPKTRNAMIIFDKFSSWCTAKPENGMFKHYTTTFLRPDSKNSKLYVVIPNTFFDGKTNELYHVHFESNQFHNKGNASIDPKPLLNSDSGIIEYFGSELAEVINSGKNKLLIKNPYMTQADKIGVGYLIFSVLDENLDSIRLINKGIGIIPKNINRFKNLTHLAIVNSNVMSVDDKICELTELKVLSLNKNPIKKIPDNIDRLKKLEYIALCDTDIKTLPDSISMLDISNGGSLRYVAISESDIVGDINNKLPNAKIIINKKTKNGKI